MPDAIPNPYHYRSPIGAALANFGKAIMSGPSEAENLTKAEMALKLKREREGVTDVASVFQQFGKPGFDRNRAMSSAIIGGVSPDHLGGYERYGAANTYGATDPRTTNAFVGAGGAFGSTAQGFRENEAGEMSRANATLAESQRQFDQKPAPFIDASGQPVIGTQSTAIGQRPIMSETDVKGTKIDQNFGRVGELPLAERRILGAAGGAQPTPRMYMAPDGQRYVTYDGVTSATTGAPLPQGGSLFNVQGTPNDAGLRPAVQGDLQKADIANQKFRGMLNFTRDLAKKSPTNFGVTGQVKGLFQDATQLAANISGGLGYGGLQEAVADAQRKAAESGINPQVFSGLFDPTLPALETAADLLVFNAAEALAGQQGRSVSDKDVALFRSIVGDPRSLLASQEQYLAKLNTIEQILNQNQAVVDQRLRPGAPVPAQQAAPGANLPTPQVPGAPPSSEEWTRGPDGRPLRVR